jgi:glycine/D-amino acid oxidase-like deaminating enzyme/nitrite reductase/ring-hydroxylating ferredoxin subunit
MQDFSGHGEQNRSIWQMTAEPIAAETLAVDESADVCVVGAGIAGLSVAYELAAAGRSVIVLEDDRIGTGMTGRTTAHVVNALDDRYFELERMLGAAKSRLAAESHTAAIERVATIVRDEPINCDFERLDGYLFNPPGESPDVIELEFAAAKRAGVALERVNRAPIVDFDTGPALRFLNQAQFHPIKYLTGLAAAIERRGGRIFTGVHAQSITGGEPARVKTARGQTITAGSVVVATNTPVNDRYVIHTKQGPYTTYVVGMPVPPGAISRALFWDTAQEAGMQKQSGPISYHYVRLYRAGDQEVLIVGGEDHKTGQTDDFESPFNALERWARFRFPMAGAVEYRWSGQVMEPIDGLGFIGHNPADEENVYIVTGDSGNGITHGVIAGMLIRDLILSRQNAWRDLYDPSRIIVKAASDFLHENLNVAAQFRDYATSGDVASADAIAPNCGAVVREGLVKIAMFRDQAGILHRFSAICPHLKCIVHWNSAERTWDCPCHGSRFDALGTVITGPANRDLESAERQTPAAAERSP